MADTYSIGVIFSSGQDSQANQVNSTPRGETTFEKEKKKVHETFNFFLKQKKYNQHLRVELWLNREGKGISELIYHHGTEEVFRN